MKRFDVFITYDNEIKYDKTYYHNKDTNDVIKIKENNIVLNPGERSILKILNRK